MYKLVETRKASRVLAGIQPKLAARIRSKMLEIANDPYGKHNNVKPLIDEDVYRLRVGDWRIFYAIEDKELIILMLDVKSRGSAYKH